MRQKYEFKSIVAETLLIPLYMRAKESRRNNPILYDKAAEWLADSLQHWPDSVPGLGTGQFENLPDSTLADYAVRMQSGRECIGAPIFFFFELGTSHLTDPSQLVNLDELARVAKKYGLKVKVTGAADSATGTIGINNALSASRADYIASELNKRGLSPDRMTKTGEGGISDYAPTEANRHTRVELFFPKSKGNK